jgi:hypothetical protein
MYIYIYMSVCNYPSICIFTYTYIYAYICTYQGHEGRTKRGDGHPDIYTYIYMYVCIYIYICIYTYTCTCVIIHRYIYSHIHIYMPINLRTKGTRERIGEETAVRTEGTAKALSVHRYVRFLSNELYNRPVCIFMY